MNTEPEQAHIHHYVPRWYQKRFLLPGQSKYYLLDLRPDTLVSGRVRYERRAVRHLGPASCFYEDKLYTLKLGNWSTDEIEKRFFGAIDTQGRRAVEVFTDYSGYSKAVHENFNALPTYMDAQRFRTPRGLDHLRSLADLRDHNRALL